VARASPKGHAVLLPEGASPVPPGGPASAGAARFPPLPVVLSERVLDLAVLRPRQRVFPPRVERPHARQARVLHHPSGGEVYADGKPRVAGYLGPGTRPTCPRRRRSIGSL
jgi:hypothetical protein